MAVYDLFNGDADGICALTQLRNANPIDSILVTGVKRDIQLLDKIDAKAGDIVTVLDVSLDKNRQGLLSAVAAGAHILYIDHHYAGEIPSSDNLKTIINTSADICTSILMNKHLDGLFAGWAVCGAFGDNLDRSAQVLAKPLELSDEQLASIKNLGVYINYNGYGSDLQDLHFTPETLYREVSRYSSPLDFIVDAKIIFEKLETGYRADMSSAANLQSEYTSDSVAVYMLPNQAWARRVSGVYGNDLANRTPSKAHAVLTQKSNGNYLISVRAPLDKKTGADDLCRQFPTGGGRSAAAGINDLPADQLRHFIDTFDQFYG